MAYLVQAELKTVIRDYQLTAITDGDDSIVDIAIEMAIEEAASILTPSNQKVWEDGRLRYDVAAIFAAEGDARNPLMLGNVKTLAIWHLIALCNTGLNYADAQDRYDRAMAYLKGLASGQFNSATLPQIADEPPADDLPYQFGSRTKFNHE